MISQEELHRLRDAAERAWDEDTRASKFVGHLNPAQGQCYVTSAWLQSRLGGFIAQKQGHYFWLSPDRNFVIDLTGDNLRYEPVPSHYEGSKLDDEDDGLKLEDHHKEHRPGPILFKTADHHLFSGYKIVPTTNHSRARKFIQRANAEYDHPSGVRKIALGWGGDAYPGEQPERQENLYWHDEPNFMWAEPESYKFVYANGQLQVSPDHDHSELAGHAGIDVATHNGPVAVGHVTVDMGKATWDIASNVSAKALQRVFKDYGDQVGWEWGGMCDLEGEPVGAGSEFAPVTSFHYRFQNEHLYVVPTDGTVKRLGQVHGTVTVRGNRARVSMLNKANFDHFKEWADDMGFVLVGNNDNVIKRVEDLEQGNIYSPEQLDAERQFFPDGEDDWSERQPGGVYKCPKCSEIFPSWNVYQQHIKDESSYLDGVERQPSGFPNTDMDATISPNYVEMRQEPGTLAAVMPTNARQAARVDGFSTYNKVWNFTRKGNRFYVAYLHGSPVGYAVVKPDGYLEMIQSAVPGRGIGKQIMAKVMCHYTDLESYAATPMGEKLMREAGWTECGNQLWKWSADTAPKDLIPADVPFIYDIQEDNITVGKPGQRTSDIPGRFTPGGIVEGVYQKGGTVLLRTVTNMPYTVRHMLELWYYSHPTMQVTGVELEDDAGKTTKLAHDEACPECGATDEYQGDLCYSCGHGDAPCPRCQFQMDGDGYCHSCGYQLNSDDAPTAAQPMMAWEMEPERATALVKGLPRIQGGYDIGGYIKAMVAADPTTDEAFKALKAAGGQVYVVGGAVRDSLLGKQPKDVDLMVTGLPAEDVEKALDALPDSRVDLTGKDFGVFRYRSHKHGGEVEVALPRKERSIGGGYRDFDVQADHSLSPEEDLFRRDFTVNAMAVDLNSGHLIDPYGGREDIQKRNLRTVNEDSLAEDPLRVVRALAAAGKHGLVPDDDTRSQMERNAGGINLLPKERVQAELDKILASPEPAKAMRLAQETGVLKHIFPEVADTFGYDQNNPHHNLDLGEHHLQVLDRVSQRSDDKDLRLAALLHDIGKPSSAWQNPVTGFNHYYEGRDEYGRPIGADHELVGADLARDRMNDLKYPKDRTNRVTHLIANHMFPAFKSPKGARKFINRVGDEHADDLLNFRWADQGGKDEADNPAEQKAGYSLAQQQKLVNDVRQGPAPTNLSQLAINGNDVIQAGIPAGPQVGQILDSLMQQTLENPELNNRESLLNIVRTMGSNG